MSLIDRARSIIREEGYLRFLVKSISFVLGKPIYAIPGLGRFCVFFARRRLVKSLNNLGGVDEVVSFAFNFKSFGVSIRPAQVYEEIRELVRIVSDLKPRVVLEIGTAGGGTLFMFARVSSLDATIISVDLPGGRFGGGYLKWRIPLYKSFVSHGQRIFLIRADFHDFKMLDVVKKMLGEKQISFLFIDDHRYEGIRREFRMYSLLVRSRGIIASHDIYSMIDHDSCNEIGWITLNAYAGC